MTKKLAETSMQTELSQSAFFRPPQQVASQPTSASTFGPDEQPFSPAPPVRPQPANVQSMSTSRGSDPSGQEAYPSSGPSVRTPMRRTITRYAFEFFQDQIDRLRAYSLEEKRRGEKGSMSEMVRQAMDLYFAMRHRGDP